MASLQRASSNIAAQIVSLATSVFDRIVLVGMLVRTWGPDIFADYSILQSSAGLLSIVEMGAQIYFQNAEQRAFVTGDRKAFQRLASIHLGMSLISVFMFMALFSFCIVSKGTDNMLRLSHLDIPTARWIFWFLGVGNLLSVLRAPASAVCSAMGDFAYITLISAVSIFANTLAALTAAHFGAKPLMIAEIYFGIYGVVFLLYFHFGRRHNRLGWTVHWPSLPTWAELRTIFGHVKWFSLQMIAPNIWLQAPVLVFAWRSVPGSEITAFLLMRSLVNQIRQSFQFAAVGAGLEIATFGHAGDFARAWTLTAQVGQATTVISGVFVGGILAFGPGFIYWWTGDSQVYDPRITIAMLLPLLAVSPLQQPMALLQYANRSREVGLLRLGLIIFGPIGCILGQIFAGPVGLAAGLGVAEILAYILLTPSIAAIPALRGFWVYLVTALFFGIVTASFSFLTAHAVQIYLKPTTLLIFISEMLGWGCFIALPWLYLTLPSGWKKAARGQLGTLFKPRG